MNLVPYSSPRLAEFESESFRRSTERWSDQLSTLLEQHPAATVRVDNVWTRLGLDRARARERRTSWEFKIYVCLRARSYWEGVGRLIEATAKRPLKWKYCHAPDGMTRPDKIVVYADSLAELRHIVTRVRRLVGGLRFHSIRHAASTSRMSLEGIGAEGLYVGLDPAFVRKLAWRWYRCVAITWASQNRPYLLAQPGGAATWFERMNISLDHEGPATLRPDLANIAFIKKTWRTVNPSLY